MSYRVDCFRIFTYMDGTPTHVPDFDLSRVFSFAEDAMAYMVAANDEVGHVGERIVFSVQEVREREPVETDCDTEFYAEVAI